MRVRFGGTWLADSEDVVLLFEPGHYPMAYFRETEVSPGTLERADHTTRHQDLGLTSWYTVRAGDRSAPRGAWQHTDPPAYAHELKERVAFAWTAMDAFYDERIMGQAADTYHRIDIRRSSRNLVVRHRDSVIADTNRPLVLYQSGFAPRWYVARVDVDESAPAPWNARPSVRTKGCAPITTSATHVWYREAYPEVGRISSLVSFEPDIFWVQLDGTRLPAKQ
jgi:uncharacterized protein (DUF427 family)